MEARVQEMGIVALLKMYYTPRQTVPCTPNLLPLDHVTLTEAVTTHKAESERLR